MKHFQKLKVTLLSLLTLSSNQISPMQKSLLQTEHASDDQPEHKTLKNSQSADYFTTDDEKDTLAENISDIKRLINELKDYRNNPKKVDIQSKIYKKITAAIRIIQENKNTKSFKDSINMRDNDGDTALHVASLLKSPTLLLELLSVNAYVNAKNNKGETPLHIAAQKGNQPMANALLEHGANIYVRDFLGKTALHYAAENGKADLANELLKNNSFVNQKDKQGNTPLHYANRLSKHNDLYASEKTEEFLLGARADKSIKNKNGKTAKEFGKYVY
ncbi:MAG: ankyrin repeat domain-containing protein [Candidatus Dependentiae bacterium]|nr:ankyrin repeat domain-containing protein [Candidatus Dependentiae bacterium]